MKKCVLSIILMVAFFSLCACEENREQIVSSFIGIENDLKSNGHINCEFAKDVNSFDIYNLRMTKNKCVSFDYEKHIALKAAFTSPKGTLPYIRLSNKLPVQQDKRAKVAIFLVGSPAKSIWGHSGDDFDKFLTMQLETYDYIYVPAYYGTAYRSVMNGSVFEFAANELDYFLEYIYTEHETRPDTLGFSGGGLLALLLPSDKVDKTILINPPLIPMKKLYEERHLPEFYGSKKNRNRRIVFFAGKNNIEDQTKYAIVEEIASVYLKRYVGEYYEISIFNHMSFVNEDSLSRTFVLIGGDDTTLGKDYTLPPDMNFTFTVIPEVNHNIFDSLYERERVTEAIQEIVY